MAVGALYWYNTSPIFADELPCTFYTVPITSPPSRWAGVLRVLCGFGKLTDFSSFAARLSPEPPQFAESDATTVDAIVEEKRRLLDAKLKAKEEEASRQAVAAKSATPQQTPPPETPAVATPTDAEKSPEQLEEEAGQQGAFNPETGEINWDCPCLGGMAHGPCGDEFKSAFSCFVYSTEEPKGMDCIDKFQYVKGRRIELPGSGDSSEDTVDGQLANGGNRHMQDCFRKYPDVYGAEIADEEEAEREAEAVATASPATNAVQDNEPGEKQAAPAKTDEKKPAEAVKTTENKTQEPKQAPTDAPKGAPAGEKAADKGPTQLSREELVGSGRGLPTRSFDATSANKVVSSK